MKVSFVIINWNTRDLLNQCLSSIKTTLSGVKYEIIVVDNASKDDSVIFIKKKHPDVEIIQNDRNLGFARAVNRGINISSGEYVCLLNTDVILLDGSISGLISYMDKNSLVGVCGGQLIYEDGRKQNSFDNFPSLSTELFNKSLLRLLFPRKYPNKNIEYKQPIEVDSIIGACFLIRKECIDKIGSLDENYFFFMEETDFCYRIWKNGYKIVFVPSVNIIHLQGQSAKKVHIRSRLEYFYSRYIFFLKNRGKLSFCVLFFLIFIKTLIKNIIYIILSVLTFFRNGKIRNKLYLFLSVLVSHLLFFPKSMRLEGNNDVKLLIKK